MSNNLSPTAIAAFFDMDKTLLSASSAVLQVRYMVKRGELARQEVIRFISALLRYKMGRLDMVETTRAIVREMAGQSEAERIDHTRQWFEEHLIDYVTEEGRRWVAAHRRLGHRVAMITASPSYTADQLAEHLGMASEDVMATRFEVARGRFTGRMLEPMIYGQGKLAIAQEYAQRHGVDLGHSYFYTDSIADLPLLEMVGYPVAVNPDRSLHRLAKAKGWSIVRFY
ncbi:MAG: HAD family hydrolase [Anaerolineae bacterium]|jgi:HAD superfamily hydrolase (TIGR01490 family)